MSENNRLISRQYEPKGFEARGSRYVITIIINIIMALFFGILTNNFVNYIGKKLGLSFHTKIFIQIIIVSLVIFAMKKISPFLHHEPEETYNYDVIFIAVYIVSQDNFVMLLEVHSNRPSESYIRELREEMFQYYGINGYDKISGYNSLIKNYN